MVFRYNAGRALMMGARGKGRQPLWVQRLKGAELLELAASHADHPLIVETTRECMEDYWDLEGLRTVLSGIREGRIRVVERETATPSPMSLQLRRAVEADQMYNYNPTPSNVTDSVYNAAKALGSELLKPGETELARASDRARKVETDIIPVCWTTSWLPENFTGISSFEPEYTRGALEAFVKVYEDRRILSQLNRVTLKTYPPEAAVILAETGFTKSMNDYVLYRQY
jgi:hypothetical protein